MGTQIKIEMPRISADGGEEDASGATLASWLVSIGDAVEQGEIIAELETDKSTLELEAPAAGALAEILVEAGSENVLPGTLLATLTASDAASEARDADRSQDPRGPASGGEDAGGADEAAPEIAESKDAAPVAPSESTRGASPVRSTPLARRAAQARGVDIAELRGTGPGGRVVEADVLGQSDDSRPGHERGRASPASLASPDSPVSPGAVAASAAPSTSSPPTSFHEAPQASPAASDEGRFETIRHSAMRKTIARRLTESKQTVPHFYLSVKCAMDEVMSIRARLNEELAASGRDTKLSVNDFVLKAAAIALRDVPAANVQFTPEAMHVFETVDLSVAVATDGGLVTPVVRNADRKNLSAIADEVKSLALRARDGTLKPNEYQGGTFTISNLGMYGIETVYPIVNPPQACILGVGAAEEEAVVREGRVETSWRARVTLAADHRAVDGAIGAQLLAAFRRRLEDPLSLIL